MPTLAELYGLSLDDSTWTEEERYGTDVSGRTSKEKDLFTQITSDLIAPTRKDTYDSFFGIKQQEAEADYLSMTDSLGTTRKGEAIGFAGSTADSMALESRQRAYASSMVDVEEQIGEKMSAARQNLAGIVSDNKATMLTLKQMDQAAEEEKGWFPTEEKDYWGQREGTGWICRRLKKEGVVSLREGLKMTKFFVKFLFSHPALAELYISHSRQLIKKADMEGFDWSNPTLKYDFISRVLMLSDEGYWDLAYLEYFNSYMNLCDELDISINYDKKLWDVGILGSIKYWCKMFKQKFFRKSFFNMLYVSYRMRKV